MKILILGGYGVFGGRLAELLSDLGGLELLIAGRNFERASAFCSSYKGAANVRPIKLDRADIDLVLLAEKPQLVVDASGPFQDYGSGGDEGRYAVVEACIKARIHYLDFADAADFVFGIARFDDAAKQAGIFAIAGVSSFPVLTAAVLRDIAKTTEIVSVTGGIAPSPFAGIGLNVMRAVIGYAGGPVKLLRGGKQIVAIGLAESTRYTIAVPGTVPLRNIRFSLVDVPDLQVIPPEHKAMQNIWMGAGPVPEVLHRCLNLLAKARATFHLPSLTPLSPLFYRVLNMMKFGEHRGGMFVHVSGMENGIPAQRSWHLLAEGDDGPYIPSMAIEAVVRKMLAGDFPEHGARAGTNALQLSDFDDLFEGRSISTGMRRLDEGESLYRQLLGSAYAQLPEPVQQLHDAEAPSRWSGRADIRGGTGLMAKAVRRIMGFPKPASDIPVSVSFAPSNDGAAGEIWTRDFDGQTFSSVQARGTGRNEHLLIETFGPMSFAMALVVEGGRLSLVPRGWSFLGIPMPKCLLPNGQTFEAQEDGKFLFSVEISMPIIGLIAGYRGTLLP